MQNRYIGPYKITTRNNDIYTVESTFERKECLKRHVNDLKKYHSREYSNQEQNNTSNQQPDDNANEDNISEPSDNTQSVQLSNIESTVDNNSLEVDQPNTYNTNRIIGRKHLIEFVLGMNWKGTSIICLIITPNYLVFANNTFEEGSYLI